MKTITLLNEKGGVGKTTLATHLAAGLAIRGGRVIVIDGDPQAHATLSLGMRERPALHDLLVRDANFNDVLESVPALHFAPEGESAGQLLLIPGNIETRVIPMLINDVWRLRRRLAQLKDHIDYVFIDTAPTPSLFHSMVYLATDAMIYPTKCERLSFDGLVKSLQHTEDSDRNRQPHYDPIQRLGIVPTMFAGRTVEHSENLNLLRANYGELVWDPVGMRIAWAEASGLNRTVFVVEPDGAAASDAWSLIDRIVAS